MRQILAAALLLGCAGQPEFSSPPTANAPRKDVVVTITDAKVVPATARALAGGSVAWVDDAMNYDAAVVFPKGFREALTCGEPRPLFFEVAAGYQSQPITGDMENVTLPCPLKPGIYPYQVYLFEAADSGQGNMDDPQLTLPATLVVE